MDASGNSDLEERKGTAWRSCNQKRGCVGVSASAIGKAFGNGLDLEMRPGGALLATPGAAVRFRIGDAFDALSCICSPRLDEGRSGSPPENEEKDEFEDEHDLVAASPRCVFVVNSIASCGGATEALPLLCIDFYWST